VTDTDTEFCHARDPANILKSQEKEKKCKYVVSMDGMMGHEAGTFDKHLSAKLAAKLFAGMSMFA
jgi:hypothetical protein